jgi:hypothetical protein
MVVCSSSSDSSFSSCSSSDSSFPNFGKVQDRVSFLTLINQKSNSTTKIPTGLNNKGTKSNKYQTLSMKALSIRTKRSDPFSKYIRRAHKPALTILVEVKTFQTTDRFGRTLRFYYTDTSSFNQFLQATFRLGNPDPVSTR